MSLPDRFVAEAADRVIVHHAHRLHERVTDRRTDELEPATQKVAAQRIGFGRPRRNLPETPLAIDPRRSADEAPHVRIEASELVLNREKGFRVAYSAVDLELVANNARISQQPLDTCGCETGHRSGIKTGERAAICLALVQDGLPTQSRLRAFEREKFKEDAIVVDGYTPFEIVIRDAERRAAQAQRTTLLSDPAIV
jgi:hypothetical protein